MRGGSAVLCASQTTIQRREWFALRFCSAII
jgi:hypothetical protein